MIFPAINLHVSWISHCYVWLPEGNHVTFLYFSIFDSVATSNFGVSKALVPPCLLGSKEARTKEIWVGMQLLRTGIQILSENTVWENFPKCHWNRENWEKNGFWWLFPNYSDLFLVLLEASLEMASHWRSSRFFLNKIRWFVRNFLERTTSTAHLLVNLLNICSTRYNKI